VRKKDSLWNQKGFNKGVKFPQPLVSEGKIKKIFKKDSTQEFKADDLRMSSGRIWSRDWISGEDRVARPAAGVSGSKKPYGLFRGLKGMKQ
jgi:hypothetical protein